MAARATAARRRDRGWEVACEDGRLVAADALVLTPPVPQTLALLDAGGCVLPAPVRAVLAAVAYDPCLAVLAVLDGPSRIPPPGGLEAGALDPRLLWIADNHQKGVSPATVTLTLHATPECRRRLWGAANDAVAGELLAAAGEWVGAAVVTAQVHRWRYARPTAVHSAPRLGVRRSPSRATALPAHALRAPTSPAASRRRRSWMGLARSERPNKWGSNRMKHQRFGLEPPPRERQSVRHAAPTLPARMRAARSAISARSAAASRPTFFTCSAIRGFFASRCSCRARKSQYSVVNGQAASPVRAAGS